MTPGAGDVIYNPTGAYVATLQSDNTYGTPVAIDYLGKLSFEYDADTDTVMSGGQYVEALAVPTRATGEMTQGAMNFAALAIMCGFTAGDYTTYDVMDVMVGGAGLPYFGLIVSYASTLGGNLLAGFPKAMLDTVPGFDVDQNKFRVGSAKFSAYAPTTTRRAAVRYKKNDVAGSIPTSAANFLAFFTTPPPSMFS